MNCSRRKGCGGAAKYCNTAKILQSWQYRQCDPGNVVQRHGNSTASGKGLIMNSDWPFNGKDGRNDAQLG